MKRRLFTTIFLLVFLGGLFLVYGGRFLVYRKSQPSTGNTLIVPLMGRVKDRALECAEVFKTRPGATVLFVTPVDSERRFYDSLQITVPRPAAHFTEVLVRLGVPAERISYLKGPASSTQDEARAIFSYLSKDTSIHEVILVTSSYHSRRAFIIFTDEFRKSGKKVTINISPSRYSDFNPNGWYTRKADAVLVTTEWTKYVYYLIIGQFL